MNSGILGAYAGLLFIGSAGLIARAIGASNPWYNGSAAAWVQGVGSLLAVAAAASIALWQTHERRITEKQRREAVVMLAKETAADSARALVMIADPALRKNLLMTEEQFEQFYPAEFARANEAISEAAKTIRELQSIALPDASLALALKRLHGVLRRGLQRESPTGSMAADGTIDRVRAQIIAFGLRTAINLHVERLG